jgi:hypothetical protein
MVSFREFVQARRAEAAAKAEKKAELKRFLAGLIEEHKAKREANGGKQC